MFTLHISSPQGVEAQFDVDSPTVALDLALRSTRLGFAWRAESRDEPPVRLTVDELRHHAVAAAGGSDAERRLLDQIEWQHQLLGDAYLN